MADWVKDLFDTPKLPSPSEETMEKIISKKLWKKYQQQLTKEAAEFWGAQKLPPPASTKSLSEIIKEGLAKVALGQEVSVDIETPLPEKTEPVGPKIVSFSNPSGPQLTFFGKKWAPDMWTFGNAKYWIDWAQAISREYGYHACLGGSILNKGHSSKDLDLYFLPLNNTKQYPATDPLGLLEKLRQTFGPLEPIGSRYCPDSELPYVYKGKAIITSTITSLGTTSSQRIDFFIMGTQAHLDLIKGALPESVELGQDQIQHFKKNKS